MPSTNRTTPALAPAASEAGGGARVLGIIMAVGAGTSFGFGGALSQILGRQGWGVFDIVAAQFLCAVVILGAMTAFTKRARFTGRDIALLVVLGAVSTISSATYYLAIDLLSVSAAVAIQFQYVWIVIVMQLASERRRPDVQTVVVIALVMGGTVLGSGVADELMGGGMSLSASGIAFALICAVFYALFIFFNGRVAPDQPPVARTFVLSLGGFAVSLVFGHGFYLDLSANVGLIPGGIAMALIMTIVPVLCIVGASTRLQSGLVAVLTSIELPAAALAGVLLLGEHVTPLVVAGVILILAGVAVSNMRKPS